MTNLSDHDRGSEKRGIWFVCADMGGDVKCTDVNMKGPIGLVIGNEGRGRQSSLVKEHCDMIAIHPDEGGYRFPECIGESAAFWHMRLCASA